MKNTAGIDHLNLMEKRVEILIGARIQERDKMVAAARSINRLRRKVKGWDSAREIRKWRNHR